MALAELVLAAASFAIGGLFMKLSDGLSLPGPSAVVFACFVAGAALQALGMRHADLSAAYIFVLGLEALFAVLLGVLYLHEGLSLPRILAIALVVAGVVWLRRT